MKYNNVITIQGRSQKTLSSPGQTVEQLPAGDYAIWASAQCHIKIHQVDAATGLSSSNGYLLRENETIFVHVPSPSYLGGVGTATISYHQVG